MNNEKKIIDKLNEVIEFTKAVNERVDEVEKKITPPKPIETAPKKEDGEAKK